MRLTPSPSSCDATTLSTQCEALFAELLRILPHYQMMTAIGDVDTRNAIGVEYECARRVVGAMASSRRKRGNATIATDTLLWLQLQDARNAAWFETATHMHDADARAATRATITTSLSLHDNTPAWGCCARSEPCSTASNPPEEDNNGHSPAPSACTQVASRVRTVQIGRCLA